MAAESPPKPAPRTTIRRRARRNASSLSETCVGRGGTNERRAARQASPIIATPSDVRARSGRTRIAHLYLSSGRARATSRLATHLATGRRRFRDPPYCRKILDQSKPARTSPPEQFEASKPTLVKPSTPPKSAARF